MEYIHVRNLEKYHPGYKDRTLQWAKIYLNMASGDPDTELLEEVDWSRLVKLILLELRAQKPLPLNNDYLENKGFNLKKRPISLTIQMLHNFIEVVTGSVEESTEHVHVDKIREEKKREDKTVPKELHLSCVYLTDEEHKKLIERYGEDGTKQRIFDLNNGIMSKGYKYKSHYHTILSWERRHDKH